MEPIESDCTFHFLYFYSGGLRHSELRVCMQQEAKAQRVHLYGQEIDLLGTSWRDASGSGFNAGLLLLIQEASLVLLAPGVSTFSRARAHWRTSGGPRPLRSQYV